MPETRTPTSYAFVTDLAAMTFAEGDGDTPATIEVCRDGRWNHPLYGQIVVTPEVRRSFEANFRANVRKVGDLPLDYDHEPGPAPGWITDLKSEGASLIATVQLTPSGRQRVISREYRFFSPEWHPNWVDPESEESHGPTLFGGAFTNRPFFRGMAAIECAEQAQEEEEMPEDRLDEDEREEDRDEEPEEEQEDESAEAEGDEEPMQASEVRRLRDEVARLTAREEKREMAQRFAQMRFNVPGYGPAQLSPAAKSELTAALLPVPAALRGPIEKAIARIGYVELGERVASEQQEVGESRIKALLGATHLGRQVLAEKKRS